MRRLIAIVVSALMLGAPSRARAHPLHTTLATVTYDPATHRVRAVVRVFLDDFSKAVARHAHARESLGVSDADALRYLASSFEIAGPGGVPVPLAWCGMRRTGDLLWLCLEGAAPFDASAMRVRDAVLCEMFDDQVNIVQATVRGTRRTTLFTPGDRLKPIAQ